MKCNYCNQNNAADESYCLNCGAPLPAAYAACLCEHGQFKGECQLCLSQQNRARVAKALREVTPSMVERRGSSLWRLRVPENPLPDWLLRFRSTKSGGSDGR
jgi:hypothetical protein